MIEGIDKMFNNKFFLLMDSYDVKTDFNIQLFSLIGVNCF
jgi:hypothetical protein